MAARNAMSNQERECLQKELATHQETAGQGYQSLHKDKEAVKKASNSTIITFDMMQNLPVPTFTHNSMFYLRQLWEYNFGVHDCTTDSATMYMWSELVAKRGADEICSCLMQYISNLPLQVKKLTCYSDSCFGQNKNFEMICFWNWQIVQGRFSQIDHKFLVRGHTYLPNDRDFSHIEKKKDTAVVYIPTHWEELVRKVCRQKPYTVKSMVGSEFKDFSDLVEQHTRRRKDSNKKDVLISKARWMNFGQGVDQHGREVKHLNEVWLRYSYSLDESWSKVSLLKGRKKIPPATSISLPIKYPNGHSILKTKVQDLKKMIPYLPEEHKQFYIDLREQSDSEDSDA